jgi:hypothetical protein
VIKFLLTVSVFGLLLSSASAAEEWSTDERLSGMQKYEFTRYIPSGTKRTIEFVYGANPDCSSIEGIEIRKTQEPEHGSLEIVPGERFPNFAKDNIRFKCNEKKIRGFIVNYKSAKDYVGPDGFDFLVLYPTEFAREVRFNLNVR